MSGGEQLGLFLGAGASFELGMPLASHATSEFKGFFNARCLNDLERGWHDQGGGHDESVTDAVVGLIERHDLRYEDILGYLQVQARRPNRAFASQCHDLYGRMVEIVYFIFYYRQILNLAYARRGFPAYEGLKGLAEQTRPLWVFSLNHDLMLELVAHHCSIPLRDGFWPEKPLRIRDWRPNGREGVELAADVLAEADIERGNLYLFKTGEQGINLIKLHGALDVFAFRDGLDICRLCPVGNALDGRLRALRMLNDEVGYWQDGHRMRVVNQICFGDSVGEMQFLRRSLLAGAHKFDKRMSQTLPQKMLDIFRSRLNYVRRLFVVGYSFGDMHVDIALRDWLESSADRSIVVVDPAVKDIPRDFAHLAPQVELRRRTAADFLAAYRSTPLTWQQQFWQHARRRLRPFTERWRVKQLRRDTQDPQRFPRERRGTA